MSKRFTATLTTDPIITFSHIEAIKIARERFGPDTADMILVIREEATDTIYTHDPFDDVIEMHDDDGNDLGHHAPGLRLVDD